MEHIIKQIQILETDILSTLPDSSSSSSSSSKNNLTISDIESKILPLLCILTKSVGEKCGHQVGKKFDEIITAYTSDLKLCKHVNGIDALNTENKPIEIKSSTLTKTCQVNFNFHTLAYSENQTKEVYADMMYKNTIDKGDVLLSLGIPKHIFKKLSDDNKKNNKDIIKKDKRYYYQVTLDHRFMAEFIRQKILSYQDDKWRSVKNINIGGRFCQQCGRVHRVDLYKKTSLLLTQDNNQDKDKNTKTIINWNHLLNTKISSRCTF